MQTANHVDFRDPLTKRVSNRGHDFFYGLFKSVSVPFFCRKCAELTGENANIRIVDVTVVDVGSVISIFSFSHRRRHNPKGI